ncbi:MAG: SprT-like domain-containing protein [Burkholderiales bacterium]|jgi:predicted SprT family Zn-dependent metalloprotease|nr:SprT-like domain-containing protein [Burkholderiales bacterium]
MDVTAKTPTLAAYSELQQAFDHFNETLFFKCFKKNLPQCLITFQRNKRYRGYYCSGKFAELNGKKQADEIAMNPQCFRERSVEETLSTLVHEMVHQHQEINGKPGRGRYHNAEWANMMESVGLMASSSGLPGGKKTGQKVSHFIISGGPFSKACAELLTKEFRISWGDRFTQNAITKKPGKNKSNRLKYRCLECGAQAWGKPDLRILCGNEDCDSALMEAAE